jgi:hypothetical protein
MDLTVECLTLVCALGAVTGLTAKDISELERALHLPLSNFANTSQLKEVANKEQEMEKHICGTLRPYKSWREFVVLSMLIAKIIYFG